jgi:hypothetical protein
MSDRNAQRGEYQTIWVFKIKQFEAHATLERSFEIPQFTVDLRDDDPFRKSFRNLLGDIHGTCFPTHPLLFATIWQSDGDLLPGLI